MAAVKRVDCCLRRVDLNIAGEWVGVWGRGNSEWGIIKRRRKKKLVKIRRKVRKKR
jgi:hypothetical protein